MREPRPGDNAGPIHRYGLGLTDQQRAVLQAYADGGRNNEIARAMGVSVKTIEAHAKNAKQRLGARTIVQAVAMYVAGAEAVEERSTPRALKA